jgi:hypothetical protein
MRKEHSLCVQDQGHENSILTLERGGKRRQEKMVYQELHDLHSSPHITKMREIFQMTKLREIGWAGHIPHIICMRNSYKIPVTKRDGNLTGRLWQRCECNLERKTDIKKQY